MAYTIELKPSAAKDLAALPKTLQRRIGRAIDRLADDPSPQGSKALKGLRGLRRLRVGDYHIVYRVQKKRLLVLIIRIRHRGDVYRVRLGR